MTEGRKRNRRGVGTEREGQEGRGRKLERKRNRAGGLERIFWLQQYGVFCFFFTSPPRTVKGPFRRSELCNHQHFTSTWEGFGHQQPFLPAPNGVPARSPRAPSPRPTPLLPAPRQAAGAPALGLSPLQYSPLKRFLLKRGVCFSPRTHALRYPCRTNGFNFFQI